MDPARAQRVAALFDQAIERPGPERAAFLQAACGDDHELMRELASLLESHESAGEFFDRLVGAVIAPAAEAVVASGRADVAGELAAAVGGRYRIERELVGGSLSRVFLAEEIGLNRQVVIKVLPPELAATTSGERFRREIQLAAQLQHPHIVPLLGADAGGRLLYYIMPYVTGESLRSRIAAQGALPVPDALRIWRDILEALDHAHSRGVVHRDIKPGNILLSGRSALVADFGIARAVEAAGDMSSTGPGLQLGTPAYMAPEQVTGDRAIDQRADVYASALVMYEMLEGQLPLGGDTPEDAARARRTQPPAPVSRPDCPPAVAALVRQCLATDPDDRPASAEVVIAQLDRPGQHAAPSRRRRLMALAVGAILLAGAVLGARYLARTPVATPIAASTASVAVLPLANLSPESGDAALADGMTEELIAALGRRGLQVAASTSVRALQGRQLDVREVAESLGVAHVVEGSLQKVGSKLRLQVRLVEAEHGSTRWSETYDREMGDVFAIQDGIARAVASELNIRLAAGAGAATALPRPTTSVAAYEWYLRGRQHELVRSAEGRRRGMEYLHRALAIDSGFAAAHAALVWLYINQPGDRLGDHALWYARAEAAALKAVALDESLAEAHAALGWSRLGGNLAGAEAALTRAVAIDPAVHRGYEGLARIYMLTRRPREQLDAARRGWDADPYSVAAIREMALALSNNGRCDQALELLRPLKDLNPPAAVAGVIRGQCFASRQMWSEAIAEFQWADRAGARAALGLAGYALARSGREAEARGLLADLLAGRRRSHGAFGIALLYAGLGEYDRAFEYLEASVKEGSDRVYIMDPLFGDLQRDPRFDRLWPAGPAT